MTEHSAADVVEKQVQKEEEEEKETRWTDDRIRWTEDADKEESDNEEEEEEECAYVDPFKDPDPFDTFSFRFPSPRATNKSTNDEEQDERDIEINLRGYKKEADAVWKSTGLTIWRASEHLCQYMVKHSEMLQGKRILELGAGLGLCGILAHHLGEGSNVCITDGDTDALVHLRDNLTRNKAKRTTTDLKIDNEKNIKTGNDSRLKSDSDCRVVSAHQLIWGRESSEAFLRRHGQGKKYDVMLASDIVYVRVIVEPLWETVKTLLKRAAGACFVMAYAKREVPVTIHMVLEAAEEAGFSHRLVDEDPEGSWVYLFRWTDAEVAE